MWRGTVDDVVVEAEREMKVFMGGGMSVSVNPGLRAMPPTTTSRGWTWKPVPHPPPRPNMPIAVSATVPASVLLVGKPVEHPEGPYPEYRGEGREPARRAGETQRRALVGVPLEPADLLTDLVH